MAIQIVATGAVTLTDLNDAQVLISKINSNSNKVQAFDPNTSAYAPNWDSTGGTPVVLTPELTIAGTVDDIISQAKSITWYKDGTAIDPATPPTGFSVATATTGKPLTINKNVMTSGINSLRITAKIVWTDARVNADITSEAEIIFSKTTQGVNGTGSNAITAVLSNESVTYGADNSGGSITYDSGATDIYVYDGATALVNDQNWTAENGKFKVTATGSNITPGGITASVSGTSRAVAAKPSNMTADSAYIDFRIQGKNAAGVAIDMTKRQVFSKSKMGQTPTTYWLMVSSNTIQKDVSGNYLPTSATGITATGYKQFGTNAPVSDASYKFRIDVDSGSGFVNGTPDASAVATKTYSSYAAGLKAIRVRMYLSNVTPNDTNFIDETIVPVVTDGAKGINSVVASVWGPNGTTTRNGASNLTAQCDVYDGVTLVSSNITYQWYILSSGSWTALTSAYTGFQSKTLTVTPGQISGQNSYKCVASYGGKTYEDTITFIDFSDPVTIEIQIPEGNVFRNSVGTKTAKCRVFKTNVGEIDTTTVAADQIYEYRWYLTKADGTPYTDATWVDSGKTYKTGKSVTVLDSHVTGTAELSCELWTKS